MIGFCCVLGKMVFVRGSVLICCCRLVKCKINFFWLIRGIIFSFVMLLVIVLCKGIKLGLFNVVICWFVFFISWVVLIILCFRNSLCLVNLIK